MYRIRSFILSSSLLLSSALHLPGTLQAQSPEAKPDQFFPRGYVNAPAKTTPTPSIGNAGGAKAETKVPAPKNNPSGTPVSGATSNTFPKLSNANGKAVESVGMVINGTFSDDAVTELNKLVALAESRNLKLGPVFFFGERPAIPPILTIKLRRLGAHPQVVTELPKRYTHFTQSPTWIFRHSRTEESVVEGLSEPASLVTPEKRFLAPPTE